ncbi:adenosylcobinamide-GDP ribazoletransferase [Chitinophaga sp. Cy-1792]|uniref:adenosylcobinamide-GDP ribazoletransferase n=1 Tax=Chitinophaga sp. Cy-1792 TaxID=2608339 RepID=UPI00141F1A0C|nr:adenosylcobinamide-GDP ribazoletransferase [Chitinophaga sp. Cy-1792]NIG52072.1 adenosylcobinamide-GDP ribazoletransferase [Chitinophaga sp. Cy-1792]
MREQWQLIRTALMFYTRLPVTVSEPYDPESLNRATRYLPLVGWITGAFMLLVVWALQDMAPKALIALLCICVSVWVTGAFHEDGFADMCDGFGGGWTKEKILEIMKDSRIGTYGMLGLLLLIATKLVSLMCLPTYVLMMAIIAAQPLSRFTALTIIYTQQYVREDELSKAKPIAKGITNTDLMIAAFFGITPFLATTYALHKPELLLTIPALLLIRMYMARLMHKWIGGYTGDCLGAVQQVAETVIYLCFCILGWKYT